jgi:hypothetical protein
MMAQLAKSVSLPVLEGFDRCKIVYIGILGDPEGGCKLLKRLVGEREFEPPTPWSRNSFSRSLKSVEIA